MGTPLFGRGTVAELVWRGRPNFHPRWVRDCVRSIRTKHSGRLQRKRLLWTILLALESGGLSVTLQRPAVDECQHHSYTRPEWQHHLSASAAGTFPPRLPCRKFC